MLLYKYNKEIKRKAEFTMNEELDRKIDEVLKKLSMEERRYLAQLIGGECNYFIVNYLKPQSSARIEAVAEFTEYLQEVFDHLSSSKRTSIILDEAFSFLRPLHKESHLRRIK